MQFKVPQFIDVEDKLFGPLTFKEFAYLAGGAGLVYVIYELLPIYFAAPLMLVAGGFALALTFYKVNSKPFIYYVQAGITYGLRSKLYVWKQHLSKPDVKKEEVTAQEKSIPTMNSSRLKDIAWSLDVLDQVHK